MSRFGKFRFNTQQFNSGSSIPDTVFAAQQDQKNDTVPKTKVEFVDTSGNVTDLSAYYESGGGVVRMKERAPNELQAGDFDIVFSNHDGTFSEYKTGSLLGSTQYHGAKIKIYFGFDLGDGSAIDWHLLQVGYIDELDASDTNSTVTFRCRDAVRSILDRKLRAPQDIETPVANGGNVGNGVCSSVNTKAFKTINENWTLTCTTPGGDGVALFSVVGSITGSIGPATSGTEFKTGVGAGGIKLTISAGTVPWSAGDKFTFSTKQAPEWSAVNPVKIIWGVLTGYDWDSDTIQPWSASVFSFDHTKASTNTQLDYDTFVSAVAQFGAAEYITGYVAPSEDASTFLISLLILFLGAMYTGNDGRLRVQSFQPTFASTLRNYADTKKVTNLGYNRAISEVLNKVAVQFKKTNLWEFTNETVIYDGIFTLSDATSIAKYGELAFPWSARWFSSAGNLVEDFASRLIAKFKEPPLVIRFDTGTDGILAEIGDHITVTDDKYGFLDTACEISQVSKNLDAEPRNVQISARNDGSKLAFSYLGSRVNEGDGLSPQAATFGAATASDKQFCYLTPDYGMY